MAVSEWCSKCLADIACLLPRALLSHEDHLCFASFGAHLHCLCRSELGISVQSSLSLGCCACRDKEGKDSKKKKKKDENGAENGSNEGSQDDDAGDDGDEEEEVGWVLGAG